MTVQRMYGMIQYTMLSESEKDILILIFRKPKTYRLFLLGSDFVNFCHWYYKIMLKMVDCVRWFRLKVDVCGTNQTIFLIK